MDIPFEINKNIFSNLQKIDLLCVLTVCKAWYRPAYETLYSTVEIRSKRSFHKFLYTIAHHELKVGQHVKRLTLVPEDVIIRGESQCVTFTKIELLARYCPALEEFYFGNVRYWRFLKDLDWDTTWLHLRRLPPANGGQDSFYVYRKIGQRVSELEICSSLEQSGFDTLLSQLTQLKVLTLHKRSVRPFNTDALNMIHANSLQLVHLVLKTRLDSQNTVLDRPPPSTLETLACTIHSPESSWFSLIRTYYSNVSSLRLTIANTGQERLMRRRSRMLLVGEPRDYIQDYVNQLMSLYIDSPIPHINILFHLPMTMTQLNQLLQQLSHQPGTTTTFSFNFTYYDSKDLGLPYHQKVVEKKLFIDSTKYNASRQHHSFRYQSFIPPEQDEMQILHYMPGTHLMTELILTRTIAQYQWSKVYVDELLHQCPRLQRLALGCNRGGHGLRCTVSSLDFTKTKYLHLEELTFTSVRVLPCVFTFVFETCYRLKYLNLIECEVDEEAFLAMEYFCMKHDIHLYYENPSPIK